MEEEASIRKVPLTTLIEHTVLFSDLELTSDDIICLSLQVTERFQQWKQCVSEVIRHHCLEEVQSQQQQSHQSSTRTTPPPTTCT